MPVRLLFTLNFWTMKRYLSTLCGAFALLFSFSFASLAQSGAAEPPSFLDGVREGEAVTLVFPRSDDVPYRLEWVFRLDGGDYGDEWTLEENQNTFDIVGADFADGYYVLAVGGGAYQELPADLGAVQPDAPLYLVGFHAEDGVIVEVSVERNGVVTTAPGVGVPPGMRRCPVVRR